MRFCRSFSPPCNALQTSSSKRHPGQERPPAVLTLVPGEVIVLELLITGSVLIAVLSRQMADEFKAWTPRVTKKLVMVAVNKLPETQRERFAEEWLSHLDDTPGEIGKILTAINLVFARIKIRRTAHKQDPAFEGPLRRIRNRVVIVAFLAYLVVRFRERQFLVWAGLSAEEPKTLGVQSDVLFLIIIVGICAFLGSRPSPALHPNARCCLFEEREL